MERVGCEHPQGFIVAFVGVVGVVLQRIVSYEYHHQKSLYSPAICVQQPCLVNTREGFTPEMDLEDDISGGKIVSLLKGLHAQNFPAQ